LFPFHHFFFVHRKNSLRASARMPNGKMRHCKFALITIPLLYPRSMYRKISSGASAQDKNGTFRVLTESFLHNPSVYTGYQDLHPDFSFI